MPYRTREVKPLEMPSDIQATTPEALAAQIRLHALYLLDQRLLDGTATSQDIGYALAYDPEKNKLEAEEHRARTKKIVSQTKYMDSQANYEKLAEEAINAFKSYQSSSGGGELC